MQATAYCWIACVAAILTVASTQALERYGINDLILAFPNSRDRIKLLNVTGPVHEGIRQYIVNCKEPSGVSQIPGVTYTCGRNSTKATTVKFGSAAAALLAHQASGGDYKWILYGDDDTLWFPPNVLSLLNTGFDYKLPYVMSDMFYYRNPCKGCAYDDRREGLHRINTHAPRCLPCHFQKPPGWDEPFFAAEVGCPCTPKLACAADPEVCQQVGFQRPAPYGGAGVLISRGMFETLNLTAYVSCLDMYSQTKGHGDDIMMQCLYDQNFAPTDPGPFLHGHHPRFSLFNSAMGMLADLLRCQEPGTKERCVKKYSKAVSLHFTEMRMLRHSHETAEALRDVVLESMRMALQPEEF